MFVPDRRWATETHSLSIKKLSGPEERYEVHDKELLVIVKALQDWRPYLAGTEKPIQIYTDHKI
jgi:hypothetical protein